MIKSIEENISKSDYHSALKLVENKLNGSFDLNSESVREELSRLNDLKLVCERKLYESICKLINDDEITRSEFAQVRRPEVSLKYLSDKKYVIEAFSQVALKKGSVESSGCKLFLCILYSRNLPYEMLLKCSSKNLMLTLEHLEAGDSFKEDLSDNKECVFIVGVDNNGQINLGAVMKALDNVLDSVYEDEVGEVGIMFTFPRTQEFKELKKIYFQLVIVQLLLKIISCRFQEMKPIFTFLFEDDFSYVSFEKTLIRLNKPDEDIRATNAKREDRFTDFINSCLTKDLVYIERLKAVYNIVDEEDVPILILGESGVGKSVLAYNIHKHSMKNEAEFEEQNCGGLSEEKLDQRLFGWKKGSFTGAVKDTKGKIARAEGGTLFLDEIDRMPQAVRSALLTFIDTQKYDILGAEKPTKANVKLIFGTNKNLKDLIKKSQFEEDFYYRINRRIIEIPPLRERINDIDIIAEYVLSEMKVKKNRYISIEPEAISYLKRYSWPGNVRELVTYIKQRYYDSLAEEVSTITLRQCEQVPFENLSVSREDDYFDFIDIMKKLLDNWDGLNGNFLDEILGPILAKTYLDDCFKHLDLTPKKENSMQIIGISGRNFSKSTLQSYYDKFPSVKKKLGF